MKKVITDFIKKNWLSVVIICGLLFLLLLGKCNNTKLSKENELKTIELSTLNDSVKTVVSKNGDLTFKLNSITVESARTRKSLEAAGFAIKDLKARDIEWGKVTDALKVEIQASGGGQITLHDTLRVTTKDTIKVQDFAWNNRFLFLNGSINKKQMDFEYKYKTGIDILNTPKGKSNIISVYLADPNAVVTSANSITITRKTKWFEKPWVWGVAGLASGYYLGTK